MSQWPYSTGRWVRLRKMHLNAHPLCVFCEQARRITPANVVDHIVPVREAKDRAFDPTNLQSLCQACHRGAKKKTENKGYTVGCDTEGNPLNGWQC